MPRPDRPTSIEDVPAGTRDREAGLVDGPLLEPTLSEDEEEFEILSGEEPGDDCDDDASDEGEAESGDAFS